jgi:hypothetical protein
MSEQKRSCKTRIFALAVSVTPQKVCGKDPSRTGIKIVVSDGGTAYITHAQNEPATHGIPVTSALPYNNVTTYDALWILTASSTADVRVQEDTD